MKKLINAVSEYLAPRKADLQTDRERLAAKEREIAFEEGVVTRYASLKDNEQMARDQFVAMCRRLESASEFSVEDFAHSFVEGHKLEELVIRLSATVELRRRLPAIKAKLHPLFVTPSEQAAKDFYRQHLDVLSRVKLKPKLEPFLPPHVPINDDAGKPEPPSMAVRIATGQFLDPQDCDAVSD